MSANNLENNSEDQINRVLCTAKFENGEYANPELAAKYKKEEMARKLLEVINASEEKHSNGVDRAWSHLHGLPACDGMVQAKKHVSRLEEIFAEMAENIRELAKQFKD